MEEIELKFQVPASARAAVDKAVAGTTRKPRMRLQAAYFDTEERSLAAARISLRVRREGRRWVQTLKSASEDGITRGEHNVDLPPQQGAAVPVPDPALHAATPVGAKLREVLDAQQSAASALVCVFRTDIMRRTRTLRTPHGRVELAFDTGLIVAGERELPVRELEIELVDGNAQAVIATARTWVARHGLWLDTRSKAERGHLLANGDTMAPARMQQRVELEPSHGKGEARRRVLAACYDQISANASQIAEEPYSDEHVHQLRVGLRRLRSALALFDGSDADPALEEPATALFRGLGVARDAAAIGEPLMRKLQKELRGVGLALELPPPTSRADAPPPEMCVRSAETQAFLLELLGQSVAEPPAPAADDPPVAEFLAHRLDHWHRQVARDSKRFAGLDDESRHRLRKRAKRLRYGAEFSGSLFQRKAVKKYLTRMRDMQDRLGELIDVMIGLAAYIDRSHEEPAALFAVGWLAARRDELAKKCEPVMASFAKRRGYWR